MAHGHKSDEKVVYVGDSRVKKSGRINSTPPDYTAFPGKSEAFIPNFLLKEWMVGCVVLVGFLVWVMAEAAPLGYPADPNNASFIPMPDWYFLFLYQFLKYPYVSGDYVLLGSIVFPLIMFGALFLAPFLDTGKERRFYRRPIASSLMLLSLVAVVYLTVVSWTHYQHELEDKGIIPEHIEREEKVREALERGEERPSFVKTADAEVPAIIEADDPAFEIVQATNCISCHATDLNGSNMAPSLLGIGNRKTSEEIAEIITHGAGGGNMPAFESVLSPEEINQIAEWLAKQTQS